MKKIFPALLLAGACILFSACGGTGGNNGDEENKGNEGGNTPPVSQLEDNSGMVYDKYDLKTYLYPLWKGNTVYNETLWFAGSQSAPLMYTPDEVLSVRSYDMKTTYEEGKDYIVEGKEIFRIENTSKIPFLAEQEFMLRSSPSAIPVPNSKVQGKYVYAAEGTDISSKEVIVTYKHSDEVKSWTKPRVETAKFPKTMQKLENGESIKILFYGDSITVGANSSEFLAYGPKAESYTNMVKSYMKKRYTKATINYVNNAVGVTDSSWGANQLAKTLQNLNPEEGDHLKVRVLDENPDLLFVAFGMNDGYYDTVQYEANIREIIRRARENNPDVEIMLISGMIANPDTPFYNKDYDAYQQTLIKIAGDVKNVGNVGVATVLNTVKSLYKTGVRFQDCTANNVNHPNDFMMRVYAQTVVYTLFGEDYIEHI